MTRSSNVTQSLCKAQEQNDRYERTISLFPSTSGTEAETNPRGPSSALEEENREDDTERQTEGGLDEHRGDGAVPLII